MVRTVTEIIDKMPGWIVQKVQCEYCSHIWTAVYHKDTLKLECNKCHKFLNLYKKEKQKPIRAFLGWLTVGWCGNDCGVQEPYGWVPECGCPIHDPEIFFHRILSIIALTLRHNKVLKMDL